MFSVTRQNTITVTFALALLLLAGTDITYSLDSATCDPSRQLCNECTYASGYCKYPGSGCDAGYKQVSLSCDAGDSICCGLANTDYLSLDKASYTKGDIVVICNNLPYESVCDNYLVGPDGIERQIAGGSCYRGCSTNSWAVVGDALGINYGDWTFKTVAKSEGKETITSTTKFTYKYVNKIMGTCEGKQNSDILCDFLGKKYTVHIGGGCGPSVKIPIKVSYDSKQEDLQLTMMGAEAKLDNGVGVRVTSAPCSSEAEGLVVLRFDKIVQTACGNGICEAGETKDTCKADCSEKEIIIEEPDEEDTTNPEEKRVSVECMDGCFYSNSCMPFGIRAVTDNVPSYCDISKSFRPQKDVKQSCQNNYECISNTCSNGVCYDTMVAACSGCTNEKGDCIPVGTRTADNYCDALKTVKKQKDVNQNCDNNYECATNFCSNGVCYDIQKDVKESRGLLERIVSFLKSLFNFE